MSVSDLVRLVALVLLLTLFTGSACGSNDAVVGATATNVANSPTPEPTSISKLLPKERDPKRAANELAATAPGLASFVTEVETANVAALLVRVPHSFLPCRPPGTRSGPSCESLGLPPETPVEFVQLTSAPIDTRTLVSARDYLGEYLKPRTALELVAVRDDGVIILLFDRDDAGLGLFRAEYDPASEGVALSDQSGINPLDFVRFDAHTKSHTYNILAAADSFHAKELAWKEELIRSNTAFPPDYN